MSGVLTSGGAAARRARRSVELTRAQTMCVVLLVVVPLPALSLGALVLPLPQLMERAAATFIPFETPAVEAIPPEAVVDASLRAPRGRRESTQRRAATTPSARPAQPRSAPVRTERKESRESPDTAVPKAPATIAATPTVAPEPTATPPPPAPNAVQQSAVAVTPPAREKPGNRSGIGSGDGSGRAKEAPASKGPPRSSMPPSTSAAPATNGGPGNSDGAGGSPSESNAGGNGNGGDGGNGGGSGKDGH